MNINHEIIHNIELLKQGNCTKFLDMNMQNILKNKLKKNEYKIYYPYKESEKVIFYKDKEPNIVLLEIISKDKLEHRKILGSILLKNKLKKNEYKIYYPYKESEKVIFYKDKEPNIVLLEIISKDKLEHRKILGSIFSLGLDSSVFGDIVITNNHYYIYLLDEIKNYFINNLITIGKSKVKLQEVNINLLDNYKREYQIIEIISSSERIDTIISHLININRNKIKEIIKNKDIILNYEILTNPSKKLITGDIFSIRKYGKYKYFGIIKETKSGNFVIKIDKYI